METRARTVSYKYKRVCESSSRRTNACNEYTHIVNICAVTLVKIQLNCHICSGARSNSHGRTRLSCFVSSSAPCSPAENARGSDVESVSRDRNNGKVTIKEAIMAAVPILRQWNFLDDWRFGCRLIRGAIIREFSCSFTSRNNNGVRRCHGAPSTGVSTVYTRACRIKVIYFEISGLWYCATTRPRALSTTSAPSRDPRSTLFADSFHEVFVPMRFLSSLRLSGSDCECLCDLSLLSPFSLISLALCALRYPQNVVEILPWIRICTCGSLLRR